MIKGQCGQEVTSSTWDNTIDKSDRKFLKKKNSLRSYFIFLAVTWHTYKKDYNILPAVCHNNEMAYIILTATWQKKKKHKTDYIILTVTCQKHKMDYIILTVTCHKHKTDPIILAVTWHKHRDNYIILTHYTYVIIFFIILHIRK